MREMLEPPWFGQAAATATREAWTIECNSYEGPSHREMGDRMADALRRVPELKSDEVRVEHEAQRSRVFYGTYPLRYKEATVDREAHVKGDVIIELSDKIKRDLRFIKKLSLDGKYPFWSARTIQKPTPDVGPPEWDLRNATGKYTLHVGVTFSTEKLQNYKKAASDWVRDLRSRGYEAYYYHDQEKPRTSICVANFGDEAFVRDARGRTGYGPLVKALQGLEEFAYNLENGHRVYRWTHNPETNRRERIPNFSFLVEIPRRRERSTP